MKVYRLLSPGQNPYNGLSYKSLNIDKSGKFCQLMEVYRLLRPDENPCDGFSNISDRTDIIDSNVKDVAIAHVGRNQYISACGSLEAAVNLRRYRKKEGGRIVKISNLPVKECHDLRTRRNRLLILDLPWESMLCEDCKHPPITLQRYHYFAETFQVVLIDAKVPHENISIGNEFEVYRLLGPNENPDHGLFAKDMNSAVSIFQHVTEGSYGKSRFISTCRTLEAVRRLRTINQQNLNPNGPIVKIIITDLSAMIFYDLHTVESRQSILQTVDVMKVGQELVNRFHNYANKFQEVLIQDYVPPAYIDVLKD